MVMKIHNIQDIGSSNTTVPIVFVSGAGGQDGSCMIDYLLRETNFRVIGGIRGFSDKNQANICHLCNEPRLQFVNFDLTDTCSIYDVMDFIKPDYFINFAAQTITTLLDHQTWETNTTAIVDCLEAIRRYKPTCRFFNAGSSEEFGDVFSSPQDESTIPKPRNLYGLSKVSSRNLIKIYREFYGLYAVQGWLFNHEGTRRGEEFVTRKITKGVSRILQSVVDGEFFEPIELGNIDARRDWSDAEDVVDAIWRMLNQERFNEALNKEHFDEWYELYNEFENKKQMTEWESKRIKDYVISSGETHTIREFIEASFSSAGLKGHWEGSGLDEKYVEDSLGWPDDIFVKINSRFYRPTEPEILCGNSWAIRRDLNWNPKTNFKQLVKKMVKNDCRNVYYPNTNTVVIEETGLALQTK